MRDGLRFRVEAGVRLDAHASVPVVATRDGAVDAWITFDRSDDVVSAPWLSATVLYGFPTGVADPVDPTDLGLARFRARVTFRPQTSGLEIAGTDFLALGEQPLTTEVFRSFRSEWIWGALRAVELAAPSHPSSGFIVSDPAVSSVRKGPGRPPKTHEQMRTLAQVLLDPPPGSGTLYERAARALGISPETVRKQKVRAVRDGWLQQISRRGKEPILMPGHRLKDEGGESA